jgi:hypothetical protein
VDVGTIWTRRIIGRQCLDSIMHHLFREVVGGVREVIILENCMLSQLDSRLPGYATTLSSWTKCSGNEWYS